MNIFPLEYRRDNESLESWCTRIAHSHCDQHQKLILEAWQMLNTNCNVLGIETDSKSIAYKNHPCTAWVKESLGSWKFLYWYAFALAVDMKDRNNKDGLHKSMLRIEDNIPYEAEASSQIVLASPDMYEALDEVNALIVEGASEGFNPHEGDWAERLFKHQAKIFKALEKAGRKRS